MLASGLYIVSNVNIKVETKAIKEHAIIDLYIICFFKIIIDPKIKIKINIMVLKVWLREIKKLAIKAMKDIEIAPKKICKNISLFSLISFLKKINPEHNRYTDDKNENKKMFINLYFY